MKRQIFEVQKKVIGMTGNNYYVSSPSGYPKIFDSHAEAYNGYFALRARKSLIRAISLIDAALRAATGAFAQAWNEICTTQNCDMGTAILMTADGFVIDKKAVGAIADLPDEDS